MSPAGMPVTSTWLRISSTSLSGSRMSLAMESSKWVKAVSGRIISSSRRARAALTYISMCWRMRRGLNFCSWSMLPWISATVSGLPSGRTKFKNCAAQPEASSARASAAGHRLRFSQARANRQHRLMVAQPTSHMPPRGASQRSGLGM